jgi:hypothetical protein
MGMQLQTQHHVFRHATPQPTQPGGGEKTHHVPGCPPGFLVRICSSLVPVLVPLAVLVSALPMVSFRPVARGTCAEGGKGVRGGKGRWWPGGTSPTATAGQAPLARGPTGSGTLALVLPVNSEIEGVAAVRAGQAVWRLKLCASRGVGPEIQVVCCP